MKAEERREVEKANKYIHPPYKMSCQTHIPEPPRETRRPPLGSGAAGPQQHLLSSSALKKATFP